MLKSCINEISKTEENKKERIKSCINSMLGFPPPYFPDMFAPRGFSEIIRMAQSKQGRTIAKAPSFFFPVSNLTLKTS